MRIGPYTLSSPVALAPMAGVTDRPFRQLCKRYGAGLAASEMVSANPELRASLKTQRRLDHSGEASPIVVQIAGADPAHMAAAARDNVALGAEIIDINMGCPAKKVCNAQAGSALLRDEALVARILRAVVQAVDVPVTLKIRTGWAPEQRNGVAIARLAEDCGIAALAVHGRTRACAFTGTAEYETLRAIKAAVRIPVIANGDITSPQQARTVLNHTGADAVMIGRAAQGRPWIFRDIHHYLLHGAVPAAPTPMERRALLLEHLDALYRFYGEALGVRVARKHIAWYCQGDPNGAWLRERINRAEQGMEQQHHVRAYFEHADGREVLAA